MEQIEQLKAMRDAAQARIAATPDYKLLISLTALIAELESVFGLAQPAPAVELPAADQRRQVVPDTDGEVDAEPGNGAPAKGILGNGSHERAEDGEENGNGQNNESDHDKAVRAVVNAEEEALDQAVADLEAELYSAGVTANRSPGAKS